jgi:hypothetical protein
MLTSALIHEFGHWRLYEAEGNSHSNIGTKQKANEYGARSIPPNFIPPSYWDDRRFALKSYETEGNWTEAQFMKELTQHRGF